ncbi:hypothetical protein CH337_19300, partial [Rhodoblastus acidophilus]
MREKSSLRKVLALATAFTAGAALALPEPAAAFRGGGFGGFHGGGFHGGGFHGGGFHGGGFH